MVDIVSGLRNISRAREGLEAVRDQVKNRDRVMMMLGPYMLSVGTASPQQIDRKASFAWPAQERIGKRPLLQFTGRGQELIHIDGVIYPEYKGGLRQMQALREMAGSGRRWLLVDGLGVVYGLYAILEVDEVGSAYTKFGSPKRIEFQLQLEYAGDSD
ncbi:phage tail protein [Natronospirillum operosum]|uniref:Phage tail protein n=1 Tax=Natronospirillum operosum TaxID=2759953 RepID=A0A4Z0WCE3_9GAMM|nr:phage tail protein [Natronospirillum operosum]TGG92535.1 phage tail protein [Natronospirillum operosum]